MSAGYELCTTLTLMRKVGDMTLRLLDGCSVYNLIKSMMLLVLLVNRRMSYPKVKSEAERDVIYLVFSRYLYFGFLIFLRSSEVHICKLPLSCM